MPEPDPITTPSDEAKHAAYGELIRPRCRQVIADKRESDKALVAAYAVDIPRLVAEAREAGARERQDAIVAWIEGERAHLPPPSDRTEYGHGCAAALRQVVARFSEQEATDDT